MHIKQSLARERAFHLPSSSRYPEVFCLNNFENCTDQLVLSRWRTPQQARPSISSPCHWVESQTKIFPIYLISFKSQSTFEWGRNILFRAGPLAYGLIALVPIKKKKSTADRKFWELDGICEILIPYTLVLKNSRLPSRVKGRKLSEHIVPALFPTLNLFQH